MIQNQNKGNQKKWKQWDFVSNQRSEIEGRDPDGKSKRDRKNKGEQNIGIIDCSQ